jgi:hypothetical protein
MALARLENVSTSISDAESETILQSAGAKMALVSAAPPSAGKHMDLFLNRQSSIIQW